MLKLKRSVLVTAVAAVAVVTAVLVAGRSAPGAVVRAPAPPAVALLPHEESTPVAAQQPAPSSDTPTEGIKVHGHWVIEVRNADGSPAARHEFDNHLRGSGADALVDLLARKITVGRWEVDVLMASVGEACSALCRLVEAGVQPLSAAAFPTLTVGTASGGGLELQGSFTADRASHIAGVGTNMSRCSTGTSPVQPCGGVGTGLAHSNFTGFTLDANSTPAGPIAVASGQIVQVTVVIRFF